MARELATQTAGQFVAKAYQTYGESFVDSIARTTGKPHQRASFYVTALLSLGLLGYKLLLKKSLPMQGFTLPFAVHNTTRFVDYFKEYAGSPIGAEFIDAQILGPSSQPVLVTPPAAGVTGGLF